MNAYELAYKLNNALGVDYEMLEQSSIMLRQQADRIAELEKEAKECWCHGHNPAYLRAKGIIGKIGDSPIHDLVHRTTPQTKPLNDEEIREISDKFMRRGNIFTFARAIEERHGIK